MTGATAGWVIVQIGPGGGTSHSPGQYRSCMSAPYAMHVQGCGTREFHGRTRDGKCATSVYADKVHPTALDAVAAFAEHLETVRAKRLKLIAELEAENQHERDVLERLQRDVALIKEQS